MSRREQVLESLYKIKQNDYQSCLIQLKTALVSYEQAKQGLHQLQMYLAEYQKKAFTPKWVGPLLTRQSFIENLNLTVKTQMQVVERSQQSLEHAQANVAFARQAMRGVEILLEKEQKQQRMHREYQENKQQDELAMMRSTSFKASS